MTKKKIGSHRTVNTKKIQPSKCAQRGLGTPWAGLRTRCTLVMEGTGTQTSHHVPRGHCATLQGRDRVPARVRQPPALLPCFIPREERKAFYSLKILIGHENRPPLHSNS